MINLIWDINRQGTWHWENFADNSDTDYLSYVAAYVTGAYVTGAYVTGAYVTGAYVTGAYVTGVYVFLWVTLLSIIPLSFYANHTI